MVRSILAVDHYQSFDLFNPYLQPTMPLIIDAIVLEIAGKYYDPWPKITKDRLAFLLAGRSWSEHGSQFPYEINPDRDVPLTFRERVKAEWHRDWLEQGLDLQRKRAVGLGAEAAELRGRIEEYEEETR